MQLGLQALAFDAIFTLDESRREQPRYHNDLCYELGACVLRKLALSRVKYYYNATVYDN